MQEIQLVLFLMAEGYLFNSDTQLNPFKKGVASFQIRYKYEFAPLSYLYLVYSRGGDIYEEDGDMSKLDTFKAAMV